MMRKRILFVIFISAFMMFNATFNTISVIPCYFTVLSSIINSLKKKCLDFVEEFKNLEDASSHYLNQIYIACV